MDIDREIMSWEDVLEKEPYHIENEVEERGVPASTAV